MCCSIVAFKVRHWLGLEQTRIQIAPLFLMLKALGTLVYYLMGGERDGASPKPRKPGTQARCEQALPIRELVHKVRAAMADVATMLEEYVDGGSTTRCFLRALGLSDDVVLTDFALRSFRRHMLGASVGVFRRLCRRLQGFPARLWLLVEPDVPDEVRLACARHFVALPECCIGIFGQGLRRLCPTVESLSSALGRTLIQTWLRSQIWTTYACEKEHAACRRICESSGSGRNWSVVARERVMEGARHSHMDHCQVDPCGVGPARGSKRDAARLVDRRQGDEDAQNPLVRTALPASPLQALPWPDQSEIGRQPLIGDAEHGEPYDGASVAPAAGAVVLAPAGVVAVAQVGADGVGAVAAGQAAGQVVA